jgi:hypothetical protein
MILGTKKAIVAALIAVCMHAAGCASPGADFDSMARQVRSVGIEGPGSDMTSAEVNLTRDDCLRFAGARTETGLPIEPGAILDCRFKVRVPACRDILKDTKAKDMCFLDRFRRGIKAAPGSPALCWVARLAGLIAFVADEEPLMAMHGFASRP